MENRPLTSHLAFVGDYTPRRCGIATFTADICEAIAAEYPTTKCIVGSVNDRPEGYDYPARVVTSRRMACRSAETNRGSCPA